MLHTHTNSGLSRRPVYDAENIGVWNLLGNACGKDMLTDAYAWVIATYSDPRSSPFVPALGLDIAAFADLLAARFPHFNPPQRWLSAQHRALGRDGALREFPGLLQLLLDHRAENDEHHRNLAHLVATACMDSGRLWKNLGLPDREALSAMLCWHFPTLVAKNTDELGWKKFLFRQLGEHESLYAC